jgi:hypothetical protein
MVATTFTQWQDLRAEYVLAYAREGSSQTVAFPIRAWPTYVYEPARDVGAWLDAGQPFTATVDRNASFFLIAPVGPSGIAFLGDLDRFVSLGRKRISQLSDDGRVHATVEFADGESQLTLHGYASDSPRIEAENGAVRNVVFDVATGKFHFTLSPTGGQRRVSIVIGSEGLPRARHPALG